MTRTLQVFAWFIIINFAVCNQIWTEPVSYWWVIEIFVLIISIFLTKPLDKSA